ncbi:NUDIX domain-containing protein [Nitrosophilus kaiyonis]|uniref:NUDIX domain-containing protein n=1 Tax=Nitrosophilus kaiyonis TaxID=2930200 RepID=UPI0024916F01|nr:NUDIX domain-containing protein [Nitrosophilus kaiyonis]
MIKNINELKNPRYIKPVEIIYEQNGIIKKWEAIKAHDSVAILIFHKEKSSFILVKQFRPALYLQQNIDFSYELCAGIVDKDKSLKEIAKEEILEETGFDVELKDIYKITSFYTSVGFAGSKQTLYYCEVEENDKIHNGGGIDDEDIEVVYIPINKAKEFMFDEKKPKTPGLLFAFCWWFENYSNNL